VNLAALLVLGFGTNAFFEHAIDNADPDPHRRRSYGTPALHCRALRQRGSAGFEAEQLEGSRSREPSASSHNASIVSGAGDWQRRGD
jgi:hypothetical protein